MSLAAAAYLPRADTVDQRLYPSRLNSRYAIATLIRRAIEEIAAAHLDPMRQPSLVDFGCGDMPYRSILAPHVGRYLGVDLPGNARAEFILREDGTTSVPDDFADVVLSTQVLEHVADPAVYLRESLRMLKAGGLLVLSTHGYWLHHADPVDYWRWTGSGLRKIIESAGFEIMECRGLMGLLPAGLQLAYDGLIRRICPKKIRPIVGPVLSLPLQTLLLLLDRLHSPAERRDEAAVFMLIARKPGKGA